MDASLAEKKKKKEKKRQFVWSVLLSPITQGKTRAYQDLPSAGYGYGVGVGGFVRSDGREIGFVDGEWLAGHPLQSWPFAALHVGMCPFTATLEKGKMQAHVVFSPYDPIISPAASMARRTWMQGKAEHRKIAPPRRSPRWVWFPAGHT